MSSPEFSAKPRKSVHWTVKSNYPLRTGSFILTFFFVSLHIWDKGYSPLFWSLLTMQLLIYPHFAFWRARRCTNSQQAEVQNLVFDTVLFGFMASVLQFPIVITFTVFIACTVNITITRGAKGTLLALAAFLSGAVIPGVIFGWHFSPETSLLTTLVCLFSNSIYMIFISITANGRNNQLRTIRETLRQNENKLKQQLIEIQDLQIKLQAKSDKEIKSLQNYLSNIIQSMPSALISIDEKGKVTQWNAAAEKIIGINSMDILGKQLWNAETRMQKFENNFYDVIKMKRPLFFHREPITYSSNKLFNISIYPLVSNGIAGAVLMMDDVTDIEKMEKQLRQAQKMEAVGNLVGGLAHDFNNVLSGITGTVSLMKFIVEQKNVDLDEMMENIVVIEESAERAADMVKQLLTLSRNHELSLTPVDLNLSIKHVEKICRNTFDKSVEINIRQKYDPVMIMADPSQIEQIILNLFINSMHAMTIMRPENEQQGGELSVFIDKIAADEHFRATHPEANGTDYWVLRIRDDGVGMEPEIMGKIFDPFFTTKKMEQGSGLGLAMVYSIVQQHKGFIDVYSEPGAGSTFSVFLPVFANAVETEESLMEEEFNYNGTGCILVVDDEDVVRRTAGKILEKCGYSIIDASDGEKAVSIYKEKQQEIIGVLLDMAMPRMSGKAVLIELLKINPHVKVIIASGFMQDKRTEEALNLGVKGFVDKPYTMTSLAKKIKEVF